MPNERVCLEDGLPESHVEEFRDIQGELYCIDEQIATLRGQVADLEGRRQTLIRKTRELPWQ